MWKASKIFQKKISWIQETMALSNNIESGIYSVLQPVDSCIIFVDFAPLLHLM